MIERLAKWGAAAENTVLVILLVTMMVLATSQIVLRNFFGAGFVWADELLRLMVLWLALAGSVAAARADKQISINVLSRFLPARGKAVMRVVANLFTAVVCGLLAYHSGRFLAASFEYEDQLLGGMPAWWFQVVMPVAFGLMCWRYVVFVVISVRDVVRGGEQEC